MRQLVQKLLEHNLDIVSMTRYDQKHTFPCLSPPQSMRNVLAEWLSVQGIAQCHIAGSKTIKGDVLFVVVETEKYAHVTFFFNGGREEPFAQEHRVLISSPKEVATYDLAPAMASAQVAEAVKAAIECARYPFVMCNLAPPDMVGHTGRYAETVKAVQATDAAIGKIKEACQAAGYILIITADHGNAEQMLDAQGHPHTAHTCNPVPLLIANYGDAAAIRQGGALCDVAPTMLSAMGIPVPQEMSGTSLLL